MTLRELIATLTISLDNYLNINLFDSNLEYRNTRNVESATCADQVAYQLADYLDATVEGLRLVSDHVLRITVDSSTIPANVARRQATEKVRVVVPAVEQMF